MRRLEEEYLRAEIEDDTAIAGTILADDYVGLRADGINSTKVGCPERPGRHERRQKPYLITATNMREHLYGDTACVTYTKVYTKPGTQAAYSENVLHLLLRRNGVWRLQLSSPLPAQSFDPTPLSSLTKAGCQRSRPFFTRMRRYDHVDR